MAVSNYNEFDTAEVQQELAASRITSSTTSGWDSIGTWLLATSVICPFMRFAAALSRSGCTAWSFVPTMFQQGLSLQAGLSIFAPNRVAAGGLAVAQTSCCSSSGRSPAKYSMPSGSIQTRPSSTLIDLNTFVFGNLSC